MNPTSGPRRAWGRQGSGQMMGPGMMGGWGFGPLGLLALVVLGIVWLFQQVSNPAMPGAGPPQALAGQPFPNCGRPTQTDWRVYPYWGQALT